MVKSLSHIKKKNFVFLIFLALTQLLSDVSNDFSCILIVASYKKKCMKEHFYSTYTQRGYTSLKKWMSIVFEKYFT